jgi:hypothetical protein
MVCCYSPFRLSAEFLPANSLALKDNCGRLSTTLKTMNKFLGSSKVYGRSSPITRFVHDLSSHTLAGVDKGNRWYTKEQCMSNSANR